MYRVVKKQGSKKTEELCITEAITKKLPPTKKSPVFVVVIIIYKYNMTSTITPETRIRIKDLQRRWVVRPRGPAATGSAAA